MTVIVNSFQLYRCTVFFNYHLLTDQMDTIVHHQGAIPFALHLDLVLIKQSGGKVH